MLYGPNDSGHDCHCHDHGHGHGYGFRPYGPGPGPYGPYGPYGYYGPYGPYRWMPRFIYGGSNKQEYIDYMKTVDYEGAGKKYYNACACKNCVEPFAVDYRLLKNLTFISTADLGFKDGKFYSENKIDGYFKADIDCPYCKKPTPFFMMIRSLPKFVMDYYLKETNNVEYSIKYSYNDFYAPFNVTYSTNGTSIKDLYEKMNSLYFDAVVHDDKLVNTTLEKINSAVIKEHGQGGTIDMDSVKDNFNKKVSVNNLKLLKYMIKSNGLFGIDKYFTADDDVKKEYRLLSK